MKRKWIVYSSLLILSVLILGGCTSESGQQEDGDELKPIAIAYLESIDDLGEMSEGFGLWYDTVSKPNSWPAFYQLDESFAEEGMTAYLFCHVSGAETPIEAEYVVPEEGNPYLQITTGWRESNEVVEPREVLAILQVDSRGTDVQQNMVNESQMSSFFTESADDITIGYVDWSVLLNEPDGELSEEAVEEVNRLFEPSAAFGNIGVNNPNGLHCFMYGSYEDVRDLDFQLFLRHFPIDSDFEEGEREILESSEAWKTLWGDWTVDDIPVPTHRFAEEDINRILEFCAGITLEDLNTETNSEVMHVGNAYYNFISDYGPGFFNCESGMKNNGELILLGESYSDEAGKQVRTEVTLKETDGRYLIQSRKVTAAE